MVKGYIKGYVLAILILLLSLVYFNSLGNGFHFDDYHHIVDNPHLKDIRNIPSFFSDTTKFSSMGWVNHYRPLLLVTYTLNYYYGRLHPAGYHAVNLAFHIGSAFLVFLIVQAMIGKLISLNPPIPPLIKGGEGGFKGEKGGLAAVYFIPLASALLFAVHPFNSEVINYITARSSVMCSFFYLLAFYYWIRFREGGGATPTLSLPHQIEMLGGGEKGGGVPPAYYLLPTTYFYIASLLVFLLGMLTKEVVITLPIMLWLYDLYFNRSAHVTQAKAGYLPATAYLLNWRNYIPYLPFVLFIAFPYVALIRYHAGVLIYQESPQRSYYLNLLTGTKVLTKYVQMLFVPVNLSIDHVVRNSLSFWEGEVIISTGFLAGILILSLWLYIRRDIVCRIVSFFIVWFFITLLPTTIIPLEAMLQENRGYLTSAGFTVIAGVMLWKGVGGIAGVAAGFSLRLRGLEGSRDRPEGLPLREGKRNHEVLHPMGRGGVYACIALTGILIATFSIITIQRNRVWKDDLTLWTDAISKYPFSARAHLALGNFYKRKGDVSVAIELYRRVLELDPDYYEAHNNLGVLYFKGGEIDPAIEEFKKALSIMPAHLNARMGLGKAYMKKGEREMAEREFEAAIALARFTHQDMAVKDALSYLKWIKERAIRGEIKQ